MLPRDRAAPAGHRAARAAHHVDPGRDLYEHLTPWQRVLVARHPSRPTTLDYIERLFTEFVEIRGDRRFADDHAIVCGMARYKDEPVLVVGHQKGSDTKQKIYRNFGYARPEGLSQGAARDAAGREVQPRRSSASSTRRPRIPGIESEERGVAEAIALNLREMAMLDRADHRRRPRRGRQRRRAGHRRRRSHPDARVRHLQRDSARRLRRHSVARLRPQGRGGRGAEADRAGPAGARRHRRDRQGADRRRAHRSGRADAAARRARSSRALAEAAALDVETRLEQRYQKFRKMGSVGTVEDERAEFPVTSSSSKHGPPLTRTDHWLELATELATRLCELPSSGSRTPATTRARRVCARAGRVAGHRAAARHSRARRRRGAPRVS